MAKFHSLKVAEVRKETDDSVAVTFEVPDELKGEFDFQPGQHLTLRAVLDGEECRRSYSICAGKDEGILRVAIKRIPEGRFSCFANDDLKPGQVLEVMTPMGHFCPVIDPAHAKTYVAFAAGSGITPILSIIKTVLA
ncbi:MAG TPA: FAD-binding oxidoreductase, partial [Sphingomonadales bacterium]